MSPAQSRYRVSFAVVTPMKAAGVLLAFDSLVQKLGEALLAFFVEYGRRVGHR